MVLPVVAAAFLLASCQPLLPREYTLRQVTVLYTNDEHGWMEGVGAGQGAANLYRLWQEAEGFTPDGPFLVLSGGDNWTGPAVSTWVQGQSMVQVMNAMTYDASAVGNHEFDFGLESLRDRVAEADYAYLTANIRYKEEGTRPTDLGLLPFTIVEVNELRVGLIGLSTVTTPATTNPQYVAPLAFLDYEGAVREAYVEVERQGVDLTMIIAHVCAAPLRDLAHRIADLEIAMIGAGHCNELLAQPWADTLLLGGGSRFTSYARATFTYDPGTDTLVDVDYATAANVGAEADDQVVAVVDEWVGRSAQITAEVIAYHAEVVARGDDRLRQAVIESWLVADPTADVAITNAGGLRTELAAGPVTIGDLVSLMPFDNTIIALSLSGAELRQVLATGSSPVLAGLDRSGESGGQNWRLRRNGEALDDERHYRVLVNSYMYAGGDNYALLGEFDPDGFDTGMNYRQPFVDWLRNRDSSADNPLRLP